MKKRLLSLLTVLTMLATLLPAGMLTASAAETNATNVDEVRTIVCVGDSLTAGALATSAYYKYPETLGRWLGDGYTVINQGRSGYCMYGGPGQESAEYLLDATLQNAVTGADTVIIMLGTNDSKYWTVEEERVHYTEHYQTMIETMQTWNPDLRFILATPPTSNNDAETGWFPNILLEDITATIHAFYEEHYASDDRFCLFDINALTKGWNVDHPNWYGDGVHFNNAGYRQLAQLFYEAFWDNTVHSFEVDSVDTVKIDNDDGRINIMADASELKGKTAVVTVAAGAQASALSLDNLPATLTVTAPYDGLTRTFQVDAVGATWEEITISSADQLKALQGQELRANYTLTSDITLDGDWTPIARLSGAFDGNGHTITMNTTVAEDNYGFIKTISADGAVKNLTIAGSVNATGRNNVGAFAYQNRGIIADCTNTAKMTTTGAFYVAGIAVKNYGLINHCGNTTNFTAGNYLGGLVEEMHENAVVVNSYNTGDITAGNFVGGIAAVAESNCTIFNCYNTGDIQGVADYLHSSIVGYGSSILNLTNVWNTGDAPKARNELVGGIHSLVLKADNFTADADSNEAVAVLNANLLGGVAWDGVTYELYKWAHDQGTPFFADETVEPLVQDANGFYHLYNREHFDWFAANVNTQRDLNVILETEIDLTGATWIPLTPTGYQGTFDGNGHTIKGLTINNDTQYTGLFARVTGGTVKDLTLENVRIASTNSYVGAVAGLVDSGTLFGVTVTGSVEATFGQNTNLGGIVGQAGSVTAPVVIENCVNKADVTLHYTGENNADAHIGGIVGCAYMYAVAGSVIRGCSNTGSVGYSSENGGKPQRVGGIAGYSGFSVLNSWNSGDVSGASDVGGIVGMSYLTGIYIVNCWNAGSVTAASNAYGGIVGRILAVTGTTCVYNCFTTTDTWGTNGTGSDCNYLYTGAQVSNTAEFVQTLNDFVLDHEDDEVYTALGGLSAWVASKNVNHPVLAISDEESTEPTPKSVTVRFVGKGDIPVAEKTVASAQELVEQLKTVKAPALGGYICVGWDNTPDDLQAWYDNAANGDILTVTAVYEVDTATTYNITVTNASATQTTGLTFDSRVTVTAIGDTTPTYWVLDGAKVGFGQRSYTFYVSGNNVIEPRTDTPDTDPAVVLQQATWASDSEGKYTLTVIAQTSLPKGWEFVSAGVMYTADSDALKALEANVNADVAHVQIETYRGAGQQYMTHLLGTAPGKERYARAYAVVSKDGATRMIWSDQVIQFVTSDSDVVVTKETI
jgi:lysophospholipase L1-like esterase